MLDLEAMAIVLRRLIHLLDQSWFQKAGLAGWLAAWLMVAALLLMPLDVPTPGETDKVVHALVFGAMAFTTIAFCRRPRTLALLAATTLAGSFALEAAQLLVPSRGYDPMDLVANGLGAALGFAAALMALRAVERVARPASAGAA